MPSAFFFVDCVSNVQRSMVEYHGDWELILATKETSVYFAALSFFTLLTLAYALKGGLRSSLITDMVQMVLFRIIVVCNF